MKQRRKVLVALLAVAVLIMGVGFAQLTGTLTIDGNAATTPAALNVVFSAASITGEPTSGESTVTGQGSTTVVFNAKGLSTKNQTVVASFTITNNNAYEVNVATPVIGSYDDTNFTVTVGDFDAAASIAAGDTKTFTVTVKLNTDSATAISTDFDITLAVTAG